MGVLGRSFEVVAFPLPLFFFLFLLHLLLMFSACDGRVVLCHPQERAALLRFKDGLSEAKIISSWGVGGQEEEDCCFWKHIRCDNRTGHVVKLNLGRGYSDSPELRGKISPSLAALKYLQRLDLNGNNFEGSSIPPFFGSFERLVYLDLSNANFSGFVPHHLGNLSSLQVLYLSDIYRIESDGEWFSRLHKLRALDLSFSNLTGSSNLLEVLNILPFLETLHLSWNGYNNNSTLLSPPHVNFTRLTEAVIDGNSFISPCWLFDVTSLENLDLEFEYIHVDVCPNDLTAKLCNLKSLSLFSQSRMPIRKNLSQFFTECNRRLNLVLLLSSASFFSGQLPGWLGEYKTLELLDLPDNNLWGSIPESIGGMTSLTELDLSGNNMSGHLPSSLWELKSLKVLVLRSNHFQGDLSEEHFVHLSNLTTLDLSSNSLQFMFSSHWVPPFKLQWLMMGSCKVGPDFPLWLQTQDNLRELNMSDSGISDVLPPWIWNFSSYLDTLDLSMNNLRGVVPTATNSSKMFSYIDLHSNMLQGSLSSFPPVLEVEGTLSLSNNLLSGPINISVSNMWRLSLWNNSFTGNIPPSICKGGSFEHINLSYNRLSGQLPSCSADQTCGITSLHLNNNNLHGAIPTWLWNCTEMVLLDMGENHFSGEIPNWISNSMPNLKVLRLRSNSFYGSIPMELSNLASLHVLDLANNNFSGPIPSTFGNFIAMKLPLLGNETLGFSTGGHFQESIMVASIGNGMLVIFTEGYFQESVKVAYKWHDQIVLESILKLFTSIDLSGNKLSGDIPAEVGRLVYLRNLNLSRNYLQGRIPKTFAKLSQLESLDLSSNNLSEGISQALSGLTFMSIFNVSFNNLSGRIPSGGQFNNYPISSYTGNLNLCGKPLQVACESDLSPVINGYNMQIHQNDDRYFLWLSLSSVLGFIMGFWTFLGTLILKRKLRYAYFHFVDNQCEKCYLLAKIYMEKCRGMWQTS